MSSSLNDPFRKLVPGEPLRIAATQYNMFVEDARAKRTQPSPTSGPDGRFWLPHVTPLIKNLTGETVPEGGLLRITGSLVAPGDNWTSFQSLWLAGDAIASQLDALAILLEPAKPDGVVRAVVSGVTAVRITGDGGTFASPQPGNQSEMQVSTSGHKLLYKAPGEGSRWGLIQIGYSGCGNTWYLSAEGLPSGGEIDFALTVNSVTETITFPCPCTLSQTRTALEGHSEIGSGGVTVDVGGTLPLVNQKIVFRDQPSEIALVENRLERTWTAPPIYRWDAC